MNLPFINESIFKPHKSPVERGESSYIYIYIYILVCGESGMSFCLIAWIMESYGIFFA